MHQHPRSFCHWTSTYWLSELWQSLRSRLCSPESSYKSRPARPQSKSKLDLEFQVLNKSLCAIHQIKANECFLIFSSNKSLLLERWHMKWKWPAVWWCAPVTQFQLLVVSEQNVFPCRCPFCVDHSSVFKAECDNLSYRLLAIWLALPVYPTSTMWLDSKDIRCQEN